MKKVFYIFAIIVITYILIVAISSIRQRNKGNDVSTWKIEEVN